MADADPSAHQSANLAGHLFANLAANLSSESGYALQSMHL